jgi:hypothetical protein
VNDQEYAAWFASLPAWERKIHIAIAVAPFVAMFVMIVLGFAGVIK